MRGKFANEYIKNTIQSLKILGFSQSSQLISTLDFSANDPLKFDKMEKMMLKVILDEISEEDEVTLATDNAKFPIDDLNAVNVARIVYLWRTYFKKVPKSVKFILTLHPLEAIIQLNALNDLLDLKNHHVELDMLWKKLFIASYKLPVNQTVKLLNEIGFDIPEIRDIIFQKNEPKLDSKRFPMSNKEYLPMMKKQLAIVKSEANHQTHSDATEMLQLLIRNGGLKL